MQVHRTWLQNVVAIALALTTLLSQGWTVRAGGGPGTIPTLSADDSGTLHLIALTQGEVKVTPPPVQVKDGSSAAGVPVRRHVPPEIASHPLALLEAVDDASPRRLSLVGIVELRI